MDFLFFIALVAGALWVWTNFKKDQSKSPRGRSSNTKSKKSSSGKFGFQEMGTDPKRDSQGRVVVKLSGGNPGISYGVNLSHLDQEVARKLAGKVNEDEEFSKSVRVRMRRDTESQYENSIIVETADAKLIGWILKEASDDAVSVLQQITSAVRGTAPELGSSEFTFEVSARIEGSWIDAGDGEEDWEADFDMMEIRIKSPVEVEVE